MKCEDVEGLMADALGEELSAEDRARFEDHLATCEKCRTEYETAQAAITTMRRLTGPGQVSVKREGSRLIIEEGAVARMRRDGPARRAGSMNRFRGILRYAASLLIAFTAGYAVHAGLMVADATRESEPAPDVVVVDRTTEDQRSLQYAVISTHARQPFRSSLAKCLIAMAAARR